MSDLIIWGAGGHGKVVLDVARSMGRYADIRFVDDDPARVGQKFCGCRVEKGGEPGTEAGLEFVIAIGGNRIRALRYMKMQLIGIRCATLLHSAALVSDSASVGSGSVVMAGAIINAQARVGTNCIINTGAIVEHDCWIGDHCHISPRAVLGGEVVVRPYAHVGIGAVVLPRVTIGEGAVVGAGAVVIHSVEPNCTVVGVPARVRPPKPEEFPTHGHEPPSSSPGPTRRPAEG
ncbi:MAG TPA: acetyltransferase [Bryobacteraceae bacterium]|nr:acetyltransferase [Bryobacteraceae bacterium]